MHKGATLQATAKQSASHGAKAHRPPVWRCRRRGGPEGLAAVPGGRHLGAAKGPWPANFAYFRRSF